MKTHDIERYIDFANRLADISGEIIRASFRKLNSIEVKADESPVTDIDREVERTLREEIESECSDNGIIGEEYGSFKEDAEFVWIIDPIDGTKAFISGIPVFGTLIALARYGEPILGIIDQPISRDRWIGADGVQTTFNGSPVCVRQCPDIAEAIIETSSPEYFKGSDRNAYEHLVGATKWAVYGGSCYAYGLLSSGFIDIGFEAEHDPFDYCALVPIVKNAGGVITDWQDSPLTIRSGTRFIAAGDKRVHAEAIRILNVE